MARKKKRTTRRRTTRRKTTRRRRNPMPRALGGILGPVEPALKNAIAGLSGAMAAKLIQRRWGGGSSESDNWDWKDYLFAALGTLGAGIGSKYLFRASSATQAKVMAGGLILIGYKLITNELVPLSATAETWLGEDGNQYKSGDRFVSPNGESYILGSNGEWLPEGVYPKMTEGTGDVIEPVSRLGDVIEKPSSLGDHWGNVWEPIPEEGGVW